MVLIVLHPKGHWRTCLSLWRFAVHASWGADLPSDLTKLVQVL